MRKTLLAGITLIAISFSLAGCLLLTREQLQSVRLFFQLAETIAAGELVEAYSSIYPESLEFKGSFVKVFGSLSPAAGTQLPDSIKVSVVATDTATEKVYHRFKLTLKLGEGGGFSAIKKFTKNLRSGTLHTVLVEPVGSDVAAGSQVALCIEVVRRKVDASPDGSCGPTASAPGGGNVFTVQVQDNSFSPKSLTIQPGDTVRWILEGNDLSHTTTAMDGAWDSGFAFDVTGAVFERKFPLAEDGETFEYSCTTHQACCAMQGSVLVGSSAPDPGDGYD